ncbi:MAG: hypothetical protein OXB96_00565 [Candidatus Kaiserbacteria bacterium]|nr:hypothetical protein [Candidatus Kaiserbacteria bacterium]
MNYTIKQTLIGVLLIAIAGLLVVATAYPSSAYAQGRDCGEFLANNIPSYKNLNEDTASARFEFIRGVDNCYSANTVSYQLFYEEADQVQKRLGGNKKARITNDDFVTISLPNDDWGVSFTDAYIIVRFYSDNASDSVADAGYEMTYTASKNAQNSAGKSDQGTGAMRPGYITCVVAGRDNCGSTNTEVRRELGMGDNDTPEPMQERQTTQETERPVDTADDTADTEEEHARSDKESQDSDVEIAWSIYDMKHKVSPALPSRS